MKSSPALTHSQPLNPLAVILHVLLLLAVLAIVAGTVVFLRGDATVHAYGSLLFWCGIGTLVLGIFSIGGTRGTARGFSAQMAQTLDADTPGARSRRAGAEMVLQFAWPLRLILAGGLAMVIGTLLGA
ncbi:MAG: hypothetical protein KDE20_00670 [Caldilineaceae bacterium]|nr:hypothetical protein [Caldilineaceae bacterium]